MHGINEGKYDNVPEPGVKLRPGTMASAANPSNADQPVIEIVFYSEDDASSDNSSASSSSVEEKQSAPAGGG